MSKCSTEPGCEPQLDTNVHVVTKVLFFNFVLSGRRVKVFFHSDASLLVSVAESWCVYSGVSVTCIYEKTIISLKLQHNSTVHVFRTNERAYMAHWQH